MATYDPATLQRYADRLYRSALFATILWTILGVELGVLLGYLALRAATPGPALTWSLAGALPGGLLGYLAGEARAFFLKLRAQTLLCWLNMDTNISLMTAREQGRPSGELFVDAEPPPPPWETEAGE